MTPPARFQLGTASDYTQSYPVIEENFPTPAQAPRMVSPRIGAAGRTTRPSYPGEENFEEQLAETEKAREQTLAGEWPVDLFAKYGLPEIPTAPLLAQAEKNKSSRDADDLPMSLVVAKMANMDAPTDLGEVLIDHLLKEGFKLKAGPGYVDFLESIPQVVAEIGEAVQMALEYGFRAKYYWGRPRPQEYGVSVDSDGTYHPEWPAGHGLAAGATCWVILERFDLTPEAQNMVVMTCLIFAMLRTLLGFHYPETNLYSALWGFEFVRDYKEALACKR